MLNMAATPPFANSESPVDYSTSVVTSSRTGPGSCLEADKRDFHAQVEPQPRERWSTAGGKPNALCLASNDPLSVRTQGPNATSSSEAAPEDDPTHSRRRVDLPAVSRAEGLIRKSRIALRRAASSTRNKPLSNRIARVLGHMASVAKELAEVRRAWSDALDVNASRMNAARSSFSEHVHLCHARMSGVLEMLRSQHGESKVDALLNAVDEFEAGCNRRYRNQSTVLKKRGADVLPVRCFGSAVGSQ